MNYTRQYLALAALLINSSILFSPAGYTQQAKINKRLPISQRPDIDHTLKDPPELPDLPAYSGKSKFVQAYVSQQGKGWTTFHCHYLAKEDMQQVKDWYENALKGYGWKIINAGPQSIFANQPKDGHTCSVIVNEAARSSGYRTQLLVQYGQAPPTSSVNQ